MTTNKIKGKTVTEEQITAWADEAETGYDPATLTPRGRPRMGSAAAHVVPVRLDPELDAALATRAEHDHTTRSDVIRDALRAWLKSA
jgi:predicted transcriptional regulator